MQGQKMQKRAKCSYMSYQVPLAIVNSAQAQLSPTLIRLLTDEGPLCTSTEHCWYNVKDLHFRIVLHNVFTDWFILES